MSKLTASILCPSFIEAIPLVRLLLIRSMTRENVGTASVIRRPKRELPLEIRLVLVEPEEWRVHIVFDPAVDIHACGRSWSIVASLAWRTSMVPKVN